MTKLRKVVTARHGKNINDRSIDDPRLTLRGIWESFALGYHLRFRARLWNPTFLVSHKQRGVETGWIVRFWFPETWFESGYFEEREELFVSAFAGHEVDDVLYNQLIELLMAHSGDVVVVTHHQLTGGTLLTKLAIALKLQGYVFTNEKNTTGGAEVLDCRTGNIDQLCGAWILDLGPPTNIFGHRNTESERHE